jgi:hypothetical protein
MNMFFRSTNGVAQWLSVCLAYMRLWVQSPLPQKERKGGREGGRRKREGNTHI